MEQRRKSKTKAEMRVRKRERDQVNVRNITTGEEGGKVKKGPLVGGHCGCFS